MEYGRQVIQTNYEEITKDNIVTVLQNASSIHEVNMADINTLFDYYRGKQAIQERTKTYHTDIMNIITENRAKEIVDFKTGYLIGAPVTYTSRKDGKAQTEINALNDYMVSEDKHSKDKALVDWQNICGTAYRIVLPDENYTDSEGKPFEETDEAPFEIFTLDPRNAFVIYSSGIGNRPLAGVYRIVNSENETVYTVYTKEKVYKVINDSIEEADNGIGMIPIIEYPANAARLGAFEPVLSLSDAINALDSNRMDGVEQFIQSLVVLSNCDLPEGKTAEDMLQAGLVVLRSFGDNKGSVDILAKELNQEQTQVLKEDLYSAVLTICAMPNRNGGSSTSDTGTAVVYRDGWSAAETAAQGQETAFKLGEMQMLKVVCSISSALNALSLAPSLIDIKFTRRNFEGNLTKATVLTQMLGCDKIDPKLAFVHSGMFTDPEQAYTDSIPYIDEAARLANNGENRTNTEEAEKPQTTA